MASTSMRYTMGTALDRAAENGVAVSILVEGSWIDGHVGAADGTGVVLEARDGGHTVIRLDRIAAVEVHAASPLATSVVPCRGLTDGPAPTVPGPRSP